MSRDRSRCAATWIGNIDDLLTMLPLTMPMKPIAATTKTTEKTMTGNLSTLCTPPLQPQFTTDVSDNVEDDFLMMLPTMMLRTTTPMTAYTEKPEKRTIDDAPAIASSPYRPQALLHFTRDIANDIEDEMTPATMIRTNTNNQMTTKPKPCPSNQSTTTAYTPSNLPPLMQPTDEFANDVEDDFDLMIPPTPSPTTTSPTPLTAYHILDPNMTDPTTTIQWVHDIFAPSPTPLTAYHILDPNMTNPTTTIQWVHDIFAPVSEALDRLEITIAKLSDRLLAATNNINTVHPPKPLTPNQQPHSYQPQLLCPSPYKGHPSKTLSRNAPNPRNRIPTQTIQQNLHPQQTHHCHRNHTKHRNFLWPPLPIFHSHFRKYLSLPVHIYLPNYLRYLANNFQPP